MLELSYLTEDRPFPEGMERPSVAALRIPSGDGTLYALCGKPGGERGEKHPAILLLHGFPGYEQNRDLARALCRIGMTVFFFHYRGCWGSPGAYRLAHLPEDAASALSFLTGHAEELSVDPEHIYVFGHSMGGFAAMNLLAERPRVRGAILMAPCDIEKMYLTDRANFDALIEGAVPVLNVDSGEVLAEECRQNAERWQFCDLAQRLDPALPMLLLTASRDSHLPPAVYGLPLWESLRSAGIRAEYHETDTGHSFLTSRIAMIRQVAEWIAAREN